MKSQEKTTEWKNERAVIYMSSFMHIQWLVKHCERQLSAISSTNPFNFGQINFLTKAIRYKSLFECAHRFESSRGHSCRLLRAFISIIINIYLESLCVCVENTLSLWFNFVMIMTEHRKRWIDGKNWPAAIAILYLNQIITYVIYVICTLHSIFIIRIWCFDLLCLCKGLCAHWLRWCSLFTNQLY